MKRNLVKTTLWLALAVLLAGVMPAEAGDWRVHRHASAAFPAHVKSLTFPSGYSISSGSSMKWGNWSVRFGPEKPVAKFVQCGPDICPNITVNKLQCSNPVVGKRKCYFQLIRHADGSGEWCMIGVLKQGEKKLQQQIDVKCPTDLALE